MAGDKMSAGDAFRALMDGRPVRRAGWPDGCYIRRVQLADELPQFVAFGNEQWRNQYQHDVARLTGVWRTDDWELHL
jgi:hypothetical protein